MKTVNNWKNQNMSVDVPGFKIVTSITNKFCWNHYINKVVLRRPIGETAPQQPVPYLARIAQVKWEWGDRYLYSGTHGRRTAVMSGRFATVYGVCFVFKSTCLDVNTVWMQRWMDSRGYAFGPIADYEGQPRW